MREIFPDLDGKDATITPKPISLIKRVLEVGAGKDALIMDSFAGSGATAHAVLKANKRDGGNRQFILVEMEDYADCLTADRVRRVINGYEFTGTKKTEFLRKKLNWKKLETAADLVAKVQGIENLEGPDYDKITKQIKYGELIVTGETVAVPRGDGHPGGWLREVHIGTKNAVFLVLVRDLPDGVMHLAVSSLSGERPTWHEMQRIKNELVGREKTAVEVYPPADEVVDGADMFHIWVLPGVLPFSLDWLRPPADPVCGAARQTISTNMEGDQ